MEEILQSPILVFSGYSLTLGKMLLAFVVVSLIFLSYRLVRKYILSSYILTRDATNSDQKRIIRNVRIIFSVFGILILILLLNFDTLIFEGERVQIRLSTLLFAALVLLLAQFLDWIIGRVILHNIFIHRDQKGQRKPTKNKDQQSAVNRVVQLIVYVFAILLILNSFQLDFTLFTYGKDDYSFEFRISNIIHALLIFMIARLIIWIVIQLVLYGYYKKKSINIGSQYAINQLLKYVIYFVALIMALESLGIQMTLIWGGAAALLVGVGLGLQDTFNDFISGIILLFERSIEVGDVVEFSSQIGTVKKIGLRASLIETRGFKTIILPNSKLVSDGVLNWSHYYSMARFEVSVGVAYGSNTELVKDLLLKAVVDHVHVLDYPSPFVRFNDFSDSSLKFDVYFFSKDFMIIEDTRSQIRFEIDKLFRENNIKIPFPQHEIWLNK
jgi:small-conductance mechanosensitive channel